MQLCSLAVCLPYQVHAGQAGRYSREPVLVLYNLHYLVGSFNHVFTMCQK